MRKVVQEGGQRVLVCRCDRAELRTVLLRPRPDGTVDSACKVLGLPSFCSMCLTQQALAAFRAESVKQLADIGVVPDGFTCDQCAYRHKCEFAFDAYNTDGDCLEWK